MTHHPAPCPNECPMRPVCREIQAGTWHTRDTLIINRIDSGNRPIVSQFAQTLEECASHLAEVALCHEVNGEHCGIHAEQLGEDPELQAAVTTGFRRGLEALVRRIITIAQSYWLYGPRGDTG